MVSDKYFTKIFFIFSVFILFAVMLVIFPIFFVNQTFIDVIINGHYQISDSSGHYDCVQEYTKYFFSGTSNEISSWCLRRPTYQILMVVPNILVLSSVSGLILIQIIASLVLVVYLFYSLVNFDRRYKVAYFALLPILFLIQIRYSISLGPESLSLNLATLSLIFLIRFFVLRESKYLLISFGFTLLAYEVRPGNPLFIIFFILYIINFILRSDFIIKSFSKFFLIMLTILLIPRLLLKVAGIEGAYHGGNFWATIYSLVSPSASSWQDAYTNFGKLAEGKSEIFLWEITRSEAIRIFMSDPSPAWEQFKSNIFIYFQYSPINLSTGVKNIFPYDWTNYTEIFFITLILIFLVIFSILLLEFYRNRDNFKKFFRTSSLRREDTKEILINSESQSLGNFALLHNFLVILLVYYYFLSESVGDGIFLTRLKTGFNIFGFHIQGLAVLTLISLIVILIKKIFFYQDVLNSINLFVIAAIFGAAVFYGVVGHDEYMRHQSQNIPFYILLFINIFRRKVYHA